MTDPAPAVAPDPAAPAPVPGQRIWVAALLLAALALALWHASQVQFICDDSYISYRYARNLVEGHGLVFNPGERVEGYTNFLWVLVLAAGMAAGLSPETWSLVAGGALLAGTLCLTFVLARRLLASTLAAALAVLLLCSLGPMILWSVAGLESICFAFLFLLAFWRLETAAGWRQYLVAGLCYALCTMTRPDGAVFGLAAGISVVVGGLFRHQPVATVARRGGALLAGFLALFAPFMAWRLSYYGDWLPNTFHVKSGAVIQWELGQDYLRAFLRDYPGLWLLTVAGAALALGSARHARVRPTLHHLLLATALFCAYVTWAGGDYMALYRFLVPVLPLAVVLVALALQQLLVAPLAGRGRGPATGAAVAATVLVGGLCFWSVQPSRASAAGEESLLHPVRNMSVNTDRWLATGRTLKDHLWPDAVIATTAAGAIPYASGLVTIDQSGLCDREVATRAHDPWMLGRPGHMKQASKRYLLERRPDLILWHPQIHPIGKSFATLPPSRDYVPRALRIDGYVDEDGADQYLYFFLHRSRITDGQRAGMVDPAQWNTEGGS